MNWQLMLVGAWRVSFMVSAEGAFYRRVPTWLRQMSFRCSCCVIQGEDRFAKDHWKNMTEIDCLQVFFMTRKTFIKYQAPAIFWMLAIFIQSSMSRLPVPDLGFRLQDKVIHAVVYAILAVLLLRAFKNWRGAAEKYIIFTLWTGSLYGVSDEIHQLFVPGRSADLLDVAADILGIVIVVVIERIVENQREKK